MSDPIRKQKEQFSVVVSIVTRRLIEHETEGWIPLPGDKPRTAISSTVRAFDSLNQDNYGHAIDLFIALTQEK